MKTKTSVQELYHRETRRMQAYELEQAGWKQKEIAVALGVTKGAVSQWLKRAREGGVEALRRHPAPGGGATTELGTDAAPTGAFRSRRDDLWLP